MKLIDGPTLLQTMFDDASRPSLRWLRAQQAANTIPFIRIGRLVFFDPEQVRTTFEKRRTIRAKA